MEVGTLLGLVIQLIQLMQPRIISLNLRMQKGESTLLLSHYINIRTCVNNEHCYEKRYQRQVNLPGVEGN